MESTEEVAGRDLLLLTGSEIANENVESGAKLKTNCIHDVFLKVLPLVRRLATYPAHLCMIIVHTYAQHAGTSFKP